MNKIKIIVIIIIAFLLSGCTFNYEAKIMLDGSVKEKIDNETFGTEVLGEEYNKEDLKISTKSYLDLIKVKANKITYKDDSVKVYVTNSYEDIEKYSKESKAIDTIFDSVQVEKDKHKILIKTIKSEYDFGISSYYGSTISISLPYKVLNHNADDYNAKTNTYSWNLDSNFNGIELEYQNNKFYTYNFIKLFNYATINTYIILVVILILIIFGIIVLIYCYRFIKTMRF